MVEKILRMLLSKKNFKKVGGIFIANKKFLRLIKF